MKVFSYHALRDFTSFQSLTLEPGSHNDRIDELSFSGCSSLQSICLPPSIELFDFRAFADLDALSSLTFEPGSKLTEIRGLAFSHGRSLQSISLPSSLSMIDCKAFIDSSIERVHIEEANRHYFMSGAFLIAFDGMKLIRYFGYDNTVLFTPQIESVCDYCFADSKVATIGFEEGSRVNLIGASAFFNCSRLKSMCIPAAVEFLGESCFDGCAALSQVTFAPGSSLVHIGSHAFERCISLTSICIPAEVRQLPNYCFRDSESFEELTFAPVLKLSRFDNQALSECFSLRLLMIPSEVEILEVGVFFDCE
jgi:hypothetical protein